jgi:protein tyrosine phosphatase (PTP) superfamily phosphohydrolase (DUF442 family)
VEDHGIRTVVTLRPEDDDRARREARALRALGVPLVRLPLAGECPPSDAQARVFLEVVSDPARRPVLVHCRHGLVRAAGIEALYRRAVLGEQAEQALRRASRFGRDLAREAPRIARFVRDYPPSPPTSPPPTGSPALPDRRGRQETVRPP